MAEIAQVAPQQANDERVLILALTRSDGQLCQSILTHNGVGALACPHLSAICEAMREGVGVLLLAQEQLDTPALSELLAMLDQQPSWSDVPVVVLTPQDVQSPLASRLIQRLGNVLLLERPVRVPNLVSVVQTALRARRRQYQIREHLQEREQSQSELSFLAEASRLLALSLDDTDTLARLARLVLPVLGDYCVIDVLDPLGEFVRVAVAHRTPAKLPLVERLRYYIPARNEQSLQGVVLQSGEPLVLNDITEAAIEAGARDAEHAEIGLLLAPRACLVVPLVARNHLIGTMLLAAEGQRRYTDTDVTLALDLAQRAGLAVDNAMLYQQAQEAIKVREQFLSIAAHELKTPLTSMLGYASVFSRRAHRSGALEERDARALATIIKQGERLNSMISALLDITRIQTGHLMIERHPLDLCAMLATLVEELAPTLDNHSIDVDCVSQTIPIMGDGLRLEQVYRNLFNNAVKYSPQGGVIRVGVSQQGDEAVVTVSDDGMGIPMVALPHLFDRFYRASNTDTQQISGIGIGLFVVKEIVTLHGGTVEVISREGVGSTFTVRLPVG